MIRVVRNTHQFKGGVSVDKVAENQACNTEADDKTRLQDALQGVCLSHTCT